MERQTLHMASRSSKTLVATLELARFDLDPNLKNLPMFLSIIISLSLTMLLSLLS